MNGMNAMVRLVAAACAAGSVAAAAQSPPGANETPGSLLYSTHCGACHTTQVHWRDGKRVKDWAGLDAEVRRWQQNVGLSWTDDDITAVARYLNAAYYRFPAPDPRAAGGGRAPAGAA